AGIVAGRVGVPDVDGGILDRRAGRGVEHLQAQRQERPAVALADVTTDLLAGDVVRALGELGRQHARDCARFDGPVAALGLRGDERAAAQAGDDQPTEPGERIATGEAIGFHARPRYVAPL